MMRMASCTTASSSFAMLSSSPPPPPAATVTPSAAAAAAAAAAKEEEAAAKSEVEEGVAWVGRLWRTRASAWYKVAGLGRMDAVFITRGSRK